MIFGNHCVMEGAQKLPCYHSNKNYVFVSVRDWVSLIPFGVVCGGLGYMAYVTFCPVSRRNLVSWQMYFAPLLCPEPVHCVLRR